MDNFFGEKSAGLISVGEWSGSLRKPE